MKTGFMTVLNIALIAGFVFFVAVNPTPAEVKKIVVLKSHDAVPYEETWRGFKEYLDKQQVQDEFKEYALNGNRVKADAAVEAAKKEGASLIFALGSLATEAVIREKTGIPTVAGMVFRMETLEQESNTTGIYLEFSWEVQFEWLKRFLPDCRTVAILYNPEENKKYVEKAGTFAKRMGFRLETRQVFEPRDLPSELKILSRKADVLLGIADKIVLTPQTSKHLLLFSFRNRIPFIGLSESWVKAGALYCLERDYRDMGAQCGEMALKIFQGAPAHAIPPSPPRKVRYCLNLKTARHLKLDISEKLVKGAYFIY